MDRKIEIIVIFIMVTLVFVLNGCTFGQASRCISQPYECSDCIDNDGDGKIDYKVNKKGVVIGDPDCTSATDICERVASAEVCDNKDNNCDGSIDEGLTRSCSTACGSGIETCSTGSWVGCTAPQPPMNYSKVCYSGVGACRRNGTIKCDGTCSAIPGTPSTEICDGLDNNCDGSIDEGFDEDDCIEKCTFNWTGNGGVLNCCGDDAGEDNPFEVVEITSDRRDNDCDGSVDGGQNLRLVLWE